MNVTTPKGLLRAAFFVCGKCFCLRGGEEHRALGLSQLQRLKNPNRYVYVENSSKNRPGGLNQMKLSHKSGTIVASDSSGDKCPVFILDMYISKLPAAAREKDLFYCRPLAVTPKGIDDSWYVAMPVGKNVLSKMVAEMCSDAGIHGRKTNHSLRVAGVSSLFDAGVPERIIQQRSGHRSLEGLRVYERVTQQQQQEVSKILAGDSKKFNTTESNSEQGKTGSTTESNPEQGKSGVRAQYNNCNFYSSPPPMPQCYYPMTPFPPPMPHDHQFSFLPMYNASNDEGQSSKFE